MDFLNCLIYLCFAWITFQALKSSEPMTMSSPIEPSQMQSMPANTTSTAWSGVLYQQDGENLRTICNLQLFSPKVLDANQANRRVKVRKLINDINESMRAGEAIDIGRAAFRTTLNLMSQTIFSVDLADQSSEMAGEYRKTVSGTVEEIAKPNLADYFPLLRKVDPQGIRRRVTYYFQKTILIFDRMIQQRENINMPETHHLILDLFGAGTDTSSATMEWTMAELLRNPEVLSKAQAELEQVIGKGKLVEETDIAQLPYLQAIIKEPFGFTQSFLCYSLGKLNQTSKSEDTLSRRPLRAVPKMS
ncbi:hypothetical protein M0R45_021559 [Rubus argutus]|uniref:Uncharacterized protein n=1 Tax=Rubus argutus TaxID=59490 RepID=A0AAW1XDB8_RUBAR